MTTERRAYERIEYPPKAANRPRFAVGDDVLAVLDCSERGLRCSLPSAPVPAIGDDIRGRVHFPTGAQVDVEGAVTRVLPDAIAVQFTSLWVPKGVIIAERRSLGLLPGQERGPAGESGA